MCIDIFDLCGLEMSKFHEQDVLVVFSKWADLLYTP